MPFWSRVTRHRGSCGLPGGQSQSWWKMSPPAPVAGSLGEAGVLEPSPPGAPAPSSGPSTDSTRASGQSSRGCIPAAGTGWVALASVGEHRLFVQSSPSPLLACDLGEQGRAAALKASSVPASRPIFLPTIQGASCDQLVKRLSLTRLSPLGAGVGRGAGSVSHGDQQLWDGRGRGRPGPGQSGDAPEDPAPGRMGTPCLGAPTAGWAGPGGGWSPGLSWGSPSARSHCPRRQ